MDPYSAGGLMKAPIRKQSTPTYTVLEKKT